MQVGEWNANRAKELIRLSGYTREKIAQEVGISGRTLKNILVGGQVPSYHVLVLLAQFLGCELTELATIKKAS